MKLGAWTVAALTALTATAGCVSWMELDDASCPPEGTALDYESFGAAFFATYCNNCHSAKADERRGAPVAYVFDSYEQVLALEERIFLRAAGDNVTMPPGPDDPPEDARDKLAEWLACGAPRSSDASEP
ncbi:MAG: hypothetical protein EXR75_08415 [Myxococcales bacterium]|nr:hypothetical protein [Myxococcales bacterium]